ncbi:GNAT family N-acetyltransferase [Actinomyces sp. zg-332]|uniref:GNAT family N-acetyltransferase n=1 Tax=Actinomyces sp. zg-332 TaxID=2708340 RepID=UPI001423BAD4|nr:GNAT family N-acetyltransferase [Actinomyces sp. zg-332]QPK94531.1 GNAT family N-acetyltransferase [Actinomyces sp. zg-332]
MGIRLANENELSQIMAIFEQAKEILKNDGIDQWQNGYPNMEVVRDDYEKKQLYVYIEEDSSSQNAANSDTSAGSETMGNQAVPKVIATCVVSYEEKGIYETSLNGKWAVDGKYAAVHRVAVSIDAKRKGYAQELMKFAYEKAKENNCKSVRVDTHSDNKRMQRVLEKTGYEFRGILTYDKDATVFRNAYDIVIK